VVFLPLAARRVGAPTAVVGSILIGLLVLPLCGAAPTFLCQPQRKVGKRKRLQTANS
jgi:hypothetical protein